MDFYEQIEQDAIADLKFMANYEKLLAAVKEIDNVCFSKLTKVSQEEYHRHNDYLQRNAEIYFKLTDPSIPFRNRDKEIVYEQYITK